MSEAALPYGPTMTRLLEPLRRGFLVVNQRFAAPALRRGFGALATSPATGSLLLLRTVGRRSGQVREAPLGYALVDGRIVVVAGYGRGAHWFANALAEPRVEVVLPGARLTGVAAEVTDPDERRRAFRAAIVAMAVVGRITVGDVSHASDARLDELAAAFPVLAITPTGILDGPFDPGGASAWVNTALGAVEVMALAALLTGAVRRGRGLGRR